MADDAEGAAAKLKKIGDDVKVLLNKIKAEADVAVVAQLFVSFNKICSEGPEASACAKQTWCDQGGIGQCFDLLRKFTHEKVEEAARIAAAEAALRLEKAAKEEEARRLQGGNTEAEEEAAKKEEMAKKEAEEAAAAAAAKKPDPKAAAGAKGGGAKGAPQKEDHGASVVNKAAAKEDVKLKKMDPTAATTLVRNVSLSLLKLPLNTYKYTPKYQKDVADARGVEIVLDCLAKASAKKERDTLVKYSNLLGDIVYGQENVVAFAEKGGHDFVLKLVREHALMVTLPF